MKKTIETCLKAKPTQPINVVLKEKDLKMGCTCHLENGEVLPNGIYKTYQDKNSFEYRYSLFSKCVKKHNFLKCFFFWLIGKPIISIVNGYEYPHNKPNLIRFETKNGKLIMLHIMK